jgi:hypothetical protein
VGLPRPTSFTGRLGLIAAASQNLGFEYAKVLYDNQGQEESGWLTGQTMAQIGASVTGLDMYRWLTTQRLGREVRRGRRRQARQGPPGHGHAGRRAHRRGVAQRVDSPADQPEQLAGVRKERTLAA